MIKIFWSGIDDRKRVWGYFVDTNIHSADFGRIKIIQTFWGRAAGNYHFQVRANTADFQKTAKSKIKKFRFTKQLDAELTNEYEKHVIFKKLKGTYG